MHTHTHAHTHTHTHTHIHTHKQEQEQKMEEEIRVLKRESSQWQKKTELEKLRLENLAHQQAEVLQLCYNDVTVVLVWRYGGVTVVLEDCLREATTREPRPPTNRGPTHCQP
jgi:hypothetical protein